jgi:hypothetical protein
MAELILTPEEQNALSLLDWSDESLAAAVRYSEHLIIEHCKQNGGNGVLQTTAGLLLIKEMLDFNATDLKIEVRGVTIKDNPKGDFTITISPQGNTPHKTTLAKEKRAEFDIVCDTMTAKERLCTFFNCLSMACTSLFLGRFSITVSKWFKVCGYSENIPCSSGDTSSR